MMKERFLSIVRGCFLFMFMASSPFSLLFFHQDYPSRYLRSSHSQRRIKTVSEWPSFIKLDRENRAITESTQGEVEFFANYFGEELAKWWLYNALQLKAGVKELKVDNFPHTITLEEIYNWCGKVYFLETERFVSGIMKAGNPSVEERIIQMLEELGYEREGNKFVRKQVSIKRNIFQFLTDPVQIMGKMLVSQISVPQPTDPAIYRPHMGRGQSYYNSEEAQMEGLSDAQTVIEYLKRYNQLITAPTVKNFILATLNPNTSTGPYLLTMVYLMKNDIPDHFIMLLHAGIRIQKLLREIHGGDMRFPDDYGPVDFWIFKQIFYKYLMRYGILY